MYGNGQTLASMKDIIASVSINQQHWEGFVSASKFWLLPSGAFPRNALKGDLHTVVTGKLEDGSARVQIYWCERSGDGTAGNVARWTPFQLGANQQQCE